MKSYKDLSLKYKKTCKCGCDIEFYGRRNQVYLNIRHKNFFNNGRRALLTQTYSEDIKSLTRSTRILEKYYPDSQGVNWISFHLLAKDGFNPDGLFHNEKDKSTGERLYRSGIYLFKLSSDNRKILIIKI